MKGKSNVCGLTITHDCRYVTVALAVAHYYWTRGNKEVMPRFPVLHAARTTLRWSIALAPHINMLCVILQGCCSFASVHGNISSAQIQKLTFVMTSVSIRLPCGVLGS